jgi:hypothetical protein
LAWDYNARPEYFVGVSAVALGVVAWPRARFWIPIGIALGVPWLVRGSFTFPSLTGLFSNEYAFARSLNGWLALAGFSAIFVTGMLALDRRGFRCEVPLLSWLGRHSLAIFLLHAVLQSRVIYPVHAYLAWRFGFAVRLDYVVIASSMVAILALTWVVLRLLAQGANHRGRELAA